MAIIVHGPGVADRVPLERLKHQAGPGETQAAAAIRPIRDEEQGPARHAAERLRSAISAAGERESAMARTMVAGQLMQESVFVLPADMPVQAARDALHQRALYQAPVVDEGGRLLGMLNLADLLGLAWPAGKTVQAVDVALSVGEVCRSPVDAVHIGVPFRFIAQLMLDKDYAALPVVDEENRIIGLIGMRDLLQAMMGGAGLEAWA